MRSTASRDNPDQDDLTARARIRDTAIHLFATQGFDVPLRAIAAEAGCSPALIMHHFGSKEHLRQACDQHVAALVATGKREILTEPEVPSAASMASIMQGLWVYDDVPGYMLQSVKAGGDLARQMLESYIAIAREVIAEGSRAGRMRLGSDPEAQARSLVLGSVGAMVAYCALTGNDLTTAEQVARYVEDITPAALEAHTYPLLTSDELLRAYTAARPARPAPQARPTEVGSTP
ncbi:MAG: TetR family transcriptional regulator [Bifidobacteriaceae bacterium]|jgi:AcrR family transcriptional regulator|nr:TetR family transcriptional regulator [Bifidobacteriaceae bacterium]